ncbi:LacI family transcriptional regulator [Microcella alkaliphila]|uniref:LacI family transcriptional regulator n=2 Tax=Microcella alkaliphila TaxID=279828 RepID=A0A4Q7U131_9MICO|nr:LacI family DNA-binding transcriptional regulator [Microcella alkaliphila]RZT66470.1 LacI family transcriptional regulator [Microcella alkaliphila]
MKRPTIRDVAQRAGVSKSLVSLVYTRPHTVSETRRQLVLDAAEELGFRPNLVARSLAGTGSGFFAILVADLHNPLFAEIVDAARFTLAAAGEVSLMTSAALPRLDDQHILDRRLLSLFHDLRPKGILIVGSVPDMQEIGGLALNVPVVVASAIPEGLPHARTVRGDDTAGMRMVVRHLAEQGHRRIAHLGGEGGPVSVARAAAYSEAMVELGLGDHIRISAADYSEAAGYAAAQQVLDDPAPPSAITAVNDLAAVGAMAAIAGYAERTGNQVALTGYDNTYLSGLREIGLTTIDPGNEAIGSLAAAMLIEEPGDAQEREHVATPSLIIRRSSASPSLVEPA